MQYDPTYEADLMQSLTKLGLGLAGGLAYRAKDDAGAYHIFSVSPDVQRGNDNEPMLNFVPMPGGGFLNVTVDLGPRKQQTEFLEQYLKKSEIINEDAPLTFHELPGKIVRIALLLGDRSGAFSELGNSRGSGLAPYSALFAVQLKQDEVPLVHAALNGEFELLKVLYEVDLDLPINVTATLHADTGKLLAYLLEQRITPDSWERTTAGAAIEKLIEQQTTVSITLHSTGSANIGPELRARLIERLLDWLEVRMSDVPEECEETIEFQEQIEYGEQLHLTLSSDAADWGASGLDLASEPP